jgi:hypothetical protein
VGVIQVLGESPLLALDPDHPDPRPLVNYFFFQFERGPTVDHGHFLSSSAAGRPSELVSTYLVDSRQVGSLPRHVLRHEGTTAKG